MLANEIVVGGVYVAKVSNVLTHVRVDEIDDNAYKGYSQGKVKRGTKYNVTNLRTGRRTSFRSASKFRQQVLSPGTQS